MIRIEWSEFAFSDAKITKTSTHGIVLVGASTRVPEMQILVSDFPSSREPDKSVNLSNQLYFAVTLPRWFSPFGHCAIVLRHRDCRPYPNTLALFTHDHRSPQVTPSGDSPPNRQVYSFYQADGEIEGTTVKNTPCRRQALKNFHRKHFVLHGTSRSGQEPCRILPEGFRLEAAGKTAVDGVAVTGTNGAKDVTPLKRRMVVRLRRLAVHEKFHVSVVGSMREAYRIWSRSRAVEHYECRAVSEADTTSMVIIFSMAWVTQNSMHTNKLLTNLSQPGGWLLLYQAALRFYLLVTSRSPPTPVAMPL